MIVYSVLWEDVKNPSIHGSSGVYSSEEKAKYVTECLNDEDTHAWTVITILDECLEEDVDLEVLKGLE